MDWNSRCLKSIARERKETEARYDIRIAQTDIYCARCGKPWGFGRHVCQDVRFETLRTAKNASSRHKKAPEMDATISQSDSGEIMPGTHDFRAFHRQKGGNLEATGDL